MTFGRWMKRLRADLDMTQEALAQQVGCAAQTIRTFEIGKRRPSRELAERLANALQVPQEQRVDFARLARAPVSAARAPSIAPGQSPPHGQGSAQVAAGHAPLLATKLYMPRPRAALVSRSRLLARLEAGLAGPLIVITAPAGFGKTTVLADWLSRQETAGRNVAWLALDAGDADPHQFLRYLIAALQTIAPSVGATTLTLLRPGQAPPIEALLPLLLNDLVQLPERSILVLDDYHIIDTPAVHQALTSLVGHLPPQLHLIIASRADPPLPLARLRARGQLTELRAHDLRFTPEEAATFLREVMGLALSVADVAALEARTEGWIAGLQLAALSLRDRSDEQRAQLIAAFTGTNRFVVDYLVDEVLARQPPHLQLFLLQTSILGRLCGRLCDAVILGAPSGGSAGERIGAQAYSQTLLEHIERSNLFIAPLDDARLWYRYHHLFAQVLRERLLSGANSEGVATLHRRASGWFEEHGLVVEAVEHALTAKDWECAARLIEAHGKVLLARGQVQTVLGWLNTLPKLVVQTRPSLLHHHALGLFTTNQLEAAELQLQSLVEALATVPLDERSRTFLGYATVLRAAVARFRGDVTHCLSLAHRAGEILLPTDIPGRTSIRLIMAWAVLLSGDVVPANERELATTIAAIRQSGEQMALFTGLIFLAGFQRRQGRLRQAAATYREAALAMPEPETLRAMPDGTAYYFGLGDLLREWNDLHAAEDLLLQGREMVRARMLAEADVTTDGYIALARLQQAHGDSAAALATIHEFAHLARERTFPAHLIARGAAARAQLALMQPDFESATSWAETCGVGWYDDLSYPYELEHLTLVRVRLAQGLHDPSGGYLHDALQLLDRLLAAAEAGARMDSVIAILIQRALALHAHGELQRALAALERALALAAPAGYLRVFVDEGVPMAALLAQELKVREWEMGDTHNHDVRAYVQQLLAVFYAEGIEPQVAAPLSSSAPRALLHHDDALTERELEVLRLLAAGHSNQAIAQLLIVAVGTVKRHVNSILSKLGVQSRLQAVAHARELGLL